MCDRSREDLMGLVDGELCGDDRRRVEQHIDQCNECREELHRFQKLSCLTGQLHLPSNSELSERGYWCGICRKLNTSKSLPTGIVGALSLVVVGNLLFFGFGKSTVGAGLAIAFVAAGLGLLWVSALCNCRH